MVLKSGPFSGDLVLKAVLVLVLLLRLRVCDDLGIGSFGKDKSRRRLGSISEELGSEEEEDMDKEESDEEEEESFEGEAGIVVSVDVDDFKAGISDLLDPLKFITFDDDAS